ncbi:MAG TPA: transposase [Acidobacteriaceae bacterium]|nr:transposase [Acidobacteriaceae bacterium]
MPTGLRRYHDTGDLHAINVNCFRKRPIFGTPEPRDTFLRILEETRRKYQFHVIGYVVMPTHVHILVSEPQNALLSLAMQVLKQRFSRTRVLEKDVWEQRYYDFNVFSSHKLAEKLDYIHMNPVTAGLVRAPADWQWSSYRAHFLSEPGPVSVTSL